MSIPTAQPFLSVENQLEEETIAQRVANLERFTTAASSSPPEEIDDEEIRERFPNSGVLVSDYEEVLQPSRIVILSSAITKAMTGAFDFAFRYRGISAINNNRHDDQPRTGILSKMTSSCSSASLAVKGVFTAAANAPAKIINNIKEQVQQGVANAAVDAASEAASDLNILLSVPLKQLLQASCPLPSFPHADRNAPFYGAHLPENDDCITTCVVFGEKISLKSSGLSIDPENKIQYYRSTFISPFTPERIAELRRLLREADHLSAEIENAASRIAVKSGMLYYVLAVHHGLIEPQQMDPHALDLLPEEVPARQGYKLVYISAQYGTEVFTDRGKIVWLANLHKTDFAFFLRAFGIHVENLDIPLLISGLIGLTGFDAYTIHGDATLMDVLFQLVIDFSAQRHKVVVPYYLLSKGSDIGSFHTLIASVVTTLPKETRQAFINGALCSAAAFALPGSVEWISSLAQAVGCVGAQVGVRGQRMLVQKSLPFFLGFLASSFITKAGAPIDASADYWNAIFDSNHATTLLQSAEKAGRFLPCSPHYLMADIDLFFKGCMLEAGKNGANNSNSSTNNNHSKLGDAASLKAERDRIKDRGEKMADARAAVYQAQSKQFTELTPDEKANLFMTVRDFSVSPKALEFALAYPEVRKALLSSNPQIINILRSNLNNEKMLNQIINAVSEGMNISSDPRKTITSKDANDYADQGERAAGTFIPVVEIKSAIKDPKPISAERFFPTLLAYQIQTSAGKSGSRDKRSRYNRDSGKAVVANYSSSFGVVDDVASDPNLFWTTDVLKESGIRGYGHNDEDEQVGNNGDDDVDERYARNHWQSANQDEDPDFTLESADTVVIPPYPKDAILKIRHQGFARSNTTKLDDAPVRHQISVVQYEDGREIEHTNRSVLVNYQSKKYFLVSADVFIRSAADIGTLGKRILESTITYYPNGGVETPYPKNLLPGVLAQVEVVSDKVIGSVFLPVAPFAGSKASAHYSPMNRFTFGDSKALGAAICAADVRVATVFPTNRATVFLHDAPLAAGDCGSPIWYNNQVIGIHNGYATLGAYRINFGHTANNPTHVFQEGTGLVLQSLATAADVDRLDHLRAVHTAHISIHQVPSMWHEPVFSKPFEMFRRSGGSGKIENVVSGFESGNLTNAPGDLIAILAEESSAKKTAKVDTGLLQSVHDRMRTTYTIACRPYFKPEIDRADFELRCKIIYSLLPKLCTASSAGLLYPTYRIPNSPSGRNTKITFLQHIRQNDVACDAFVAHVDKLWTRSNASNDSFCPVPVYIKKEAMKTTKLLDGHSRTIKSPPLEIDLILAMLSFRVADRESYDSLVALPLDEIRRRFSSNAGMPEVSWVSPDDILYSCGPSSNSRLHACAVGCNIAKVVKSMKKPKESDSFVSLDVSGWDKTLPYELMEALFIVFCGKSLRTSNLCRWLNRDSILVFNNHCIKQASPSWCSGNRFTLSGNSLIHDALLRVSKFATPLLIQGDDAVVTLDAKKAGDLTAHYAKFGLVLKQATVSEHAFDFCKLVVERGVTETNLESSLNKAVTQGGIPLHSLLDIAGCVDSIAKASADAPPAIRRVIDFVRAVRENQVLLIKSFASSLKPDDDEFVIDLVMPETDEKELH